LSNELEVIIGNPLTAVDVITSHSPQELEDNLCVYDYVWLTVQVPSGNNGTITGYQ
jgi:hypothetical protein